MDDGKLMIEGEKLLDAEYELLLEPKNPENSAPLSSQDALVVLDLELTDEDLDGPESGSFSSEPP